MEIFFTAYCLRKLFEASKVSNSTTAFQFTVKVYPFIGVRVTKYNWHKFDEHYDFRKPTTLRKDALFLCNQLIHSYVFAPYLKRTGGLKGVIFCSEKERHKQLYELDIDDLIRYLKKVGTDYPNYSSAIFDSKKQDFVITQQMLKENEK